MTATIIPENTDSSLIKSREELDALQWQSLRSLLARVFERNPFYRGKWTAAGVRDWRDIASLDDFQRLPFITRLDLSHDQGEHPPYGTNLTWPLDQYIRWYRTSGTKGKPLIILATRQDVLADARARKREYAEWGLGPGDGIFIIASFGPFRAFWGAEAGARELGLLMMPGGGMNTLQRVQFILQQRPAAICCLPSYALRLLEVAAENGLDLRQAGVRVLFLGGEPGASLPSVRARLQAGWGGAGVSDGFGLSEVSQVARNCQHYTGLHLLDEDCLVEVLEPGGSQPVPDGEVGELVITSLVRDGMPIIRYRTGDLVRRVSEPCPCGRPTARLLGGVLSRADGMITVRGINIYPTAMEELLMSHPEVVEYRVEIFERREMKELRVLVETAEADPASPQARAVAERIAQDLRQKMYLRAEVEPVASGSLPRLEGKAKRFVQIS